MWKIQLGFFVLVAIVTGVVFRAQFASIGSGLSQLYAASSVQQGGSGGAQKKKQSKVIKGAAAVIDGNTMDVGGTRIGLVKYRACSPGQIAKTPDGSFDCGEWAKKGLSKIAEGQEMECGGGLLDDNGQLFLDCLRADGKDVGLMMIEEGYGFPSKIYPMTPEMQKALDGAKSKKTGIWAFENLKQS
jgi:endonuclease YncB( thermonuclease family)